MKIIDKRKDYYDFLVGKYGVDPKCIYYRNSIDIQAFTDYYIQGYNNLRPIAIELWKIFKKQPLTTPKLYWIGNKPPLEDDSHFDESRFYRMPNESLLHDSKYFAWISSINLIIGKDRYYIEVLRYLDKDDNLYYDMLWEKRELYKRISDAPIYIDTGDGLTFNDCKHPDLVKDYIKNEIIENPLLKNTFIPSIIMPEEIWISVENYISSLNTEKTQDNMTNNEKILSHGFDLKTSFRNVK